MTSNYGGRNIDNTKYEQYTYSTIMHDSYMYSTCMCTCSAGHYMSITCIIPQHCH